MLLWGSTWNNPLVYIFITEGASLCPPHHGWCWSVCYSHFLSQSRSVSEHWGGNSWTPILIPFPYLHSFHLLYSSFCLIIVVIRPRVQGFVMFLVCLQVSVCLSDSSLQTDKLPFWKFQSMVVKNYVSQ